MGEHMGHSQLEDINEIHVRNPNYKGKNYDPNVVLLHCGCLSLIPFNPFNEFMNLEFGT